ncbi:MAG: hypothetical protein N2V75_08105 [Methanophagales archaeon]|nr:hypothetical protein [Methanophagales archaeon]
MGGENKSEGAVIKGRFFRDGLRINPFKKSVDGKTLSRLILSGLIGLILVRLGLWSSPPIDTFYFAFAFGLYLDVRVEIRELRREIREKK